MLGVKNLLAGGRSGNLIGVMLNTAQSVVGIISNTMLNIELLNPLHILQAPYTFLFS